MDYEYERAGTACIFVFAEPLSGWRSVKARELEKRIEFCYTPKHGSWLNVAENELSSMTRQCLSGRRIENIERLRSETQAWAKADNDKLGKITCCIQKTALSGQGR
ncbi:MAG: transposase [Desulfuromonas sp.]|nr:transposase [Desulfuromonas sp.]